MERTINKLRVAIHGAAGRMGRRLVAIGSSDPAFKIVVALESASHPDIGKDAGELAGVGAIGVPLSSHINTDVDVVVDFSIPEAALAIAGLCVDRKIPLV